MICGAHHVFALSIPSSPAIALTEWTHSTSPRRFLPKLDSFGSMAHHASMDREADPAEVAAVAAAFERVGLDVTVEASVTRKAAPQAALPWVIYLQIEAGIFIAAFVAAAGKTLGEKTAGAAWEGLRRLLNEIRDARRNRSDGALILRDETVKEEVVLTPVLPDQALKSLFELELHKTESSTMMWDPEQGRWRDPLEQ